MSGISRIAILNALVLCLIAGPDRVGAEDAVSGVHLVSALQGGGFIIYVRHAATDWSQSDDVRSAGDWTSCDGERIRQLSDRGRETARAVGDAIRRLEIPISVVLASPYCRTVETAELMTTRPVQATTDVMNMRVAEYFGGREAVAATARRRLATPPEPGTNTLIVAHGNVAREATSVYPGEAEALIFRPDGHGSFHYLGRLTPTDWIEIAGTRKPP